MDDPLDFENEDLLVNAAFVNKKRKKVIGLDDLLTDFYKEKTTRIDKKNKQVKSRKNYNSDEDDKRKEAALSKSINQLQTQMTAIGTDEEFQEWGLAVFGKQKVPLPNVVYPDVGDCSLLHSFVNNKLSSLLDITPEKGNTFLEGLLVNGWLTKLVFTRGQLEKSIAEWTFNLILYSTKEMLMTSAVEFWCAILLSQNEASSRPVKISWFPSYSEVKVALETYGYLFDKLSNTESLHTGCSDRGPPQNIRAWMRFTAACFQIRSRESLFSTLEAEQLVEAIICMFLDRQLQVLSVLLVECVESVISYFKDEEWNGSCESIAKSLATRVPNDLNCLRIVEAIPAVSSRGKHLRNVVAYQKLLVCFDHKDTDEELMTSLISINLRKKECDLFKIYIYLVLTEHWFQSNPMLNDKPVMKEMWAVYLRNCSCQIGSTDLRCFASKVRNKASFLLQGCGNKQSL